MLTDEQKGHFETVGFVVLKNFIPQDDIQIYADEFDKTMMAGLDDPGFEDVRKRRHLYPFYRHNPEVWHHLLDSDAIEEVVTDLIGEDFVFSVSEGMHHFRGTSWHHDSTAPTGQTHLKVVLFLNPVRKDTGCLSLLPGSQFVPYRERMEANGASILPRGNEVPGVWFLESDPGDAVVFNVSCYHAAFSEVERKGIYLNYIQKPQNAEQEAYIEWLYKHDGERGHVYYSAELFEDVNPRRMSHLRFIQERCYRAV